MMPQPSLLPENEDRSDLLYFAVYLDRDGNPAHCIELTWHQYEHKSAPKSIRFPKVQYQTVAPEDMEDFSRTMRQWLEDGHRW